MKRRHFLKQTGKAAAFAAVTAGTGFVFHNRDSRAYTPLTEKTGSFEVDPDKQLPTVALARNEDHVQALRSSLDAVGGIKRFVTKGDRVTVKPNAGWDRTPEQAANTNPMLVAEMVRQCLEAGASQVIVTDVTCNDPRRCFIRSGIREAVEKVGGLVILAAQEDYVTVDMGGEMLGTWPVLKHFIETDRLINMPVVKHHSLSRCTIGMKNLYGIIGGRRHKLHQQIDQSIVDLTSFSTPTLTVVDATRVLVRSGPQGGSLDDVEHHHSVICATDPVAADSRGCEFIGLKGHRVGHIRLAQESGLGSLDYESSGYKELAG